MIEMELSNLLVRFGFLGGVIIAAALLGIAAICVLAARLAVMRMDMEMMEDRLNDLERVMERRAWEDEHGA